MALTIAEANAVQRLLRHMRGRAGDLSATDRSEAASALAFLSQRSYAALGAGERLDEAAAGEVLTARWSGAPDSLHRSTPPGEASPARWIDDNGRTTCRAHAGHYLQHALKADPDAELHFTPIGSFLRDTSGEVECETCPRGKS